MSRQAPALQIRAAARCHSRTVDVSDQLEKCSTNKRGHCCRGGGRGGAGRRGGGGGGGEGLVKTFEILVWIKALKQSLIPSDGDYIFVRTLPAAYPNPTYPLPIQLTPQPKQVWTLQQAFEVMRIVLTLLAVRAFSHSLCNKYRNKHTHTHTHTHTHSHFYTSLNTNTTHSHFSGAQRLKKGLQQFSCLRSNDTNHHTAEDTFALFCRANNTLSLGRNHKCTAHGHNLVVSCRTR